MNPYAKFFHSLTGHPPYPYQERLATEPWPAMLDVATGLGKTAAVLGAWIFKRLAGDPETGIRLVYCLPMRTLVEQTAEVAAELLERAVPRFADAGLELPEVHVLMGGVTARRWDETPERAQILVGTQDMLLSRALNRGYAMNRYRWPVHFGLLNNDCLWVLDETQLMGVGVETSAQLQGFRESLGTLGPARTLWMSATLGAEQIATIDHQPREDGWKTLELVDDDRDSDRVRTRLEARKAIASGGLQLQAKAEDSYLESFAGGVLEAHTERGGLTLVVVNRVARAQKLFERLRASDHAIGLVHSRFRPADRARHQAILGESGDRIVVATQAVEAGVDVSATTLFTELAPWSSLVQRFGRCNRYGEVDHAAIRWLDIDTEDPKDKLALPYDPAELDEARQLLSTLDDAGPAALREVSYSPPPVIRPIIRRRDLLELFDTSPDLSGLDIDVSRFVRDGTDTDVSLLWRTYDEARPPSDAPAPERTELCRASIGAARTFADKVVKKRKRLDTSKKKDRERAWTLSLWRWDPLEKQWARADTPRPGEILWAHPNAGGYDAELGWTGEVEPATPVAPLAPESGSPPESFDGDPDSARERWIRLTAHLHHVETESRRLDAAITDELLEAVAVAARWHDVGKAHPEFQDRLIMPVADEPELCAPDDGPWAKSNHRRSWRKGRGYFRHELASALAWLATTETDGRRRDLVAYLIAAHHGKIRVSIRSLPAEKPPPRPERLYARGVWDGDELPAVTLPTGEVVGPVELSLDIMQLGAGSWVERVVTLRDDPELGPLRLAYLESLVRVADWRASENEQKGRYDD